MARSGVVETAQRIQRKLRGGHRAEVLVLASPVAPGDTTVLFDSQVANLLRPGSTLNIGFELMKVRTASTNAATVIRGWDDTEPGTHAAGDIGFADSRYTLAEVVDEMRSELSGWPEALFRVVAVDLELAAGARFVVLPDELASMYSIVGAWRMTTGAYVGDGWNPAWPQLTLDVQRGAPGWAASGTSGLIANVHTWGDYVPGGPARVIAAMPWPTDWATTADLIDDVGLSAGQIDVLELGVRVRMLTDEAATQGQRGAMDEPRRAAEAPPGVMAQTNGALFASYRYRMTQEITKLRARFPVRVMA